MLKTCKSKKITICRPVTVSIHPSAKIEITQEFIMNKNWLSTKSFNAGYLSIGKDAHVEVNSFIAYNGCTIGVAPNAHLKIGKSYMNCDSKIRCYKEIIIDDHVAISENVIIRDNDDHKILDGKHIPCQPIHICNHVWIGMGAIILKGVTIGEGSIIGAGAVVTHNIPPYSLAVGVPAEVIKSNINWE